MRIDPIRLSNIHQIARIPNCNLCQCSRFILFALQFPLELSHDFLMNLIRNVPRHGRSSVSEVKDAIIAIDFFLLILNENYLRSSLERNLPRGIITTERKTEVIPQSEVSISGL